MVIPVLVRYATPTRTNQELVLNFRYKATRPLTVRGTVQLGLQSGESLKGLRRTVRVGLGKHVIGVESPGAPDWCVLVPEAGGRDERSLDVEIVWRGAPRLGPIKDRLQLVPIAGNDRRLQPVVVEVTGEVVDDTITLPREIKFGRCPLGARPEEPFQIVSLGGRGIRDVVVESCPPGVTITVKREADGRFATAMRATVTACGEQAAAAVLSVTDDRGGITRLPVPFSYLGFSAP